jgi:sec-independent protein translocase protein TatC
MDLTFIGHVHELRRRLLISGVVVLLGGVVAYYFRQPLLGWLEAPLHQTLYYSRVTGAFEFIVQACLLVGFIIGAPFIIYQLYTFIQPALPRRLSKRSVTGLILLSSILMLTGIAFGYYVSLPTALHFLGSIDTAHLHPLIAADSYMKFIINYLAVFALVFLLPLFFLTADHISPLPTARLRRIRKWVIIGAFSAALILPVAPDPISQIMLALPIVVMYEVSVWLIVLSQHLRRDNRKKLVDDRPNYL